MAELAVREGNGLEPVRPVSAACPGRAVISGTQRQVARRVGGINLRVCAHAVADSVESPVAGTGLVPAFGGDLVHPLHDPVDGDDRIARQVADVFANPPLEAVGVVLAGTADLAVGMALTIIMHAIAAGDHDRDALHVLGMSPAACQRPGGVMPSAGAISLVLAPCAGPQHFAVDADLGLEADICQDPELGQVGVLDLIVVGADVLPVSCSA